MREKINPFMDSVTSQNITFNRDIEMKDIENNSKFICKCYATIVANKSISYYMDVLEPEIFNQYRESIQVEIDKYIKEAKELALRYNVPFVM